MKRTIRITESQLNRVVNQVINEACNEMAQVPTASLKGQDTIQKIQAMVDQANQAYQSLEQEYGKYSLMDNEGTPYSLKAPIKLMMNGYMIFPFDSGTDKMKVFTKAGGRIKLFPGDWYTEGWKDARKLLNRIIKDADRGMRHIQHYDPNLEGDSSPEARAQKKEINKKIGFNAYRGY